MLFPRFRSRERDLRSDVERLSIVEQAVNRAIADAESELVGLGKRLEDARARAAFLYGDVIDGETERDRESNELVDSAERFLVRGERRREELTSHFEVLYDLRRRVSDAMKGLAADGAED